MRNAYSQEQIANAKQITKIVGDTSNLLILLELINFGEKSFNELRRMTDINAVTLSKKLSQLKSDGYIQSQKFGIENRYSVTKKSVILDPIIKDIELLIKKA